MCSQIKKGEKSERRVPPTVRHLLIDNYSTAISSSLIFKDESGLVISLIESDKSTMQDTERNIHEPFVDSKQGEMSH
jgi:hypothetical protein